MGTWGQKTFANDAVLDWLDDLEGSAKDGRFLVKWLNYVVKAKSDTAMDEWQEALGAAEVVAASRSEASTHVPKKVYQWINRVGYCASEEDLQLAGKAVQKIQQSPSLREEMNQAKQLAKWEANLQAIFGRLNDALAKPLIPRTPQKIKSKPKSLADLVVQWGHKPTDATRRSIQKELSQIKDVNKWVGGKGINPLAPVHWLASRGLLVELKSVVGRGADVNAKSIQCGVPVACAVREGHWETASYLLEVGADRQEAVTMAICSDQADILLKLMAYGIKIPDVAVLGSPARGSWVHIAVANLGTRVLKVFLELGFNANAQNLSGFTPLHFCVYCGNLAAAELLLSHGARADIRDSNGMTALDLAKKWKRSHFQRLLVSS